MKRFAKVYLEISNICNLRCSFCPGTKRPGGMMKEDAFRLCLEKLQPWTDFLYFHLMGEPLCHPDLEKYLRLAGQAGFRVILTTNGTLLGQKREMLLQAPGLHKVNISLHAFEANDLAVPFAACLEDCFAFGKAAEGRKLVVYRLWNQGGLAEKNRDILEAMEAHFPKPWKTEPRGTRIAQRIYLEYGEKFDWPDRNAPEGPERVFCYGLRDQIGVLWDGTVVPCCLDHEGDIPLGNLLTQDLSQILATTQAQGILEGFSRGKAVHPLCRRCGYARRFG